MKKAKRTTWETNSGRELLIEQQDGRLNVVPAYINADEAIELAEALTDYAAGCKSGEHVEPATA